MPSPRPSVPFTIALAALALLPACAPSRWPGIYPTAEYRLHLRTPSGAPAAGLRLEVVDATGRPAWAFPADDLRKGTPIASDARGVVTFHHVGGGYELGVACLRLFNTVPVAGGCADAIFTIRLLAGDRVAATLPFASLHQAFPDTPAGAARFRALPTTRATIPLRVDRARNLADRVDPRARSRIRGLAAQEEWDALVDVALDFAIIDRDVTIPDAPAAPAAPSPPPASRADP